MLPISPGTFPGLGGMPKLSIPGVRTIERPHPEWAAHSVRWAWLLDSWEGGEAYRTAVYGYDSQGMPVRNLVRHKREYPSAGEAGQYGPFGRPAGTDMAAQATDDDYELRRARTPVPTFLAEAITSHLTRIYSREIKRTGPAELERFWADPTGRREGKVDAWFPAQVAPLLLTLGHLDFLVDRPSPPPGVVPRTRADDYALKLDRAMVTIVLPTDVVWWRLDELGRYAEVVIREAGEAGPAWRYWNAWGWILFDHEGRPLRAEPHPYKRPPLVRVFDRRRPRCDHVGLPRYEPIAEIQREFYNRDSELILSDTTQAHPLLQAPEDYFRKDGKLPLGPNWLLPKKKNGNGPSFTYEGFDVIEFPKEGAESLRANKLDLRDQVDRAALLIKPAGAAGTNGSTVAQSGTSKRLDQSQGNDLLCQIAEVLATAEGRLAELAILVTSGGAVDPSTAEGEPPFRVVYPKQFDLADADELASQVGTFQAIVAGAGSLPEAEFELLSRLFKLMCPGLEDADYTRYDAEIRACLDDAAKRRKAEAESQARTSADPDDPGPVDPAADPKPDVQTDDDADPGAAADAAA